MSDVRLDADLLGSPPRLRPDAKRVLMGAAVLTVAVVGFVVLGSPAAALEASLQRMRAADPVALALAGLAEAGSFAGYIALTWLVVGRGAPRIGFLVSGQITLAGAAITRVLPTAGLGGIGLTLWALRRAGRTASQATGTLLTFLVVTYAVFLAALTVAGIAVLAHAAGGAPAWVGVGPVAFGTTALALAAVVAAVGPRRLRGDHDGPTTGRLRGGAAALHAALHDAATVVASRDVRLLGAPAWWGLDLAVLALAFAALGDTPAIAIVAVGYFAGIVANTMPVPGAVAGGMTGVLLLCGLPIDLVLPAVLLYRAVSLWLPVPVGLAALIALRRHVHRWTQEDGPTSQASTRLVVGLAQRAQRRMTTASRASGPGAPRPAGRDQGLDCECSAPTRLR